MGNLSGVTDTYCASKANGNWNQYDGCKKSSSKDREAEEVLHLSCTISRGSFRKPFQQYMGNNKYKIVDVPVVTKLIQEVALGSGVDGTLLQEDSGDLQLPYIFLHLHCSYGL